MAKALKNLRDFRIFNFFHIRVILNLKIDSRIQIYCLGILSLFMGPLTWIWPRWSALSSMTERGRKWWIFRVNTLFWAPHSVRPFWVCGMIFNTILNCSRVCWSVSLTIYVPCSMLLAVDDHNCMQNLAFFSAFAIFAVALGIINRFWKFFLQWASKYQGYA